MTAHELLDVSGTSTLVARCGCGWQSTPARSPDHARERWRIHRAQCRTDATVRRMATLHEAARQEFARLEEMRGRARAQRDRLNEQLRSLRQRSWEVRRNSIDMLGPPVAAGVALDRAREMTGQSVIELWWEYFALGGRASPSELAAILRGDRAIERFDHDVVACALNEQFAAAGFGHPVDDWDTAVRLRRS